MWKTLLLLTGSNIFMTFAWYGHLKHFKSSPLWVAISVSWGIAFFEYCLQVPANRIGHEYFSLPQLKVMQEFLTMLVFAGFSIWYMGESLNRNYFYSSICLLGAVYFMFRK